MKVIGLSLDNKILLANSSLARRTVFYAIDLDEFVMIVPGFGRITNITDKVRVFPSGTDNKILSIFFIYRQLSVLLKTGGYQLVSIQDNYFLAVVGVYLAKKYKVKVEIQNHGFEKLNWWRRYLVSWSFKRADLIRTVSQRLLKLLQKEFNVDPDKIYIVPVPIEIDHLKSVTRKLDLHEIYSGKFIFLSVGRLVPIKNVSLQIQALARLKDQDIILLIVGDGPDRDSLEKLVQDLNISAQVFFLGWLDELADYYRTSDCLLLTSFSEGFPLVPSEATIYELPIIMTDVGSAGDLIKDQINALIIPINDCEALSVAMKKIKNDHVLRLKLKQGSRLACDKILKPEQTRAMIKDQWQKIITKD